MPHPKWEMETTGTDGQSGWSSVRTRPTRLLTRHMANGIGHLSELVHVVWKGPLPRAPGGIDVVLDDAQFLGCPAKGPVTD